MQLRSRKSRSNGADDLGQLLTLGENRDGLDDRLARSAERMSPVHPLFVFDHLRREFVLAHRRDHIVGEPGACADLVDPFLDPQVRLGVLLEVRELLPPASVVEIAPSVNQL